MFMGGWNILSRGRCCRGESESVCVWYDGEWIVLLWMWRRRGVLVCTTFGLAGQMVEGVLFESEGGNP